VSGELRLVHRFEPGSASATLLLLHGTGGDENDLVPLGRELAPGANLLSPRGAVVEHGMPRFFRRLAEGVFDEEDLVRRAAELAAFLDAAAEHHGFDRRRVHALGYSNGANIAAALLLLHPGSLAGGVLLRPVLPLEPPAPPALEGVPVLLSAGSEDPYAPHERVEALAERLRAGGAEVELAWRAAGHGLVPADLDHAGAWLARHVTGESER
jgi:predicted esterase